MAIAIASKAMMRRQRDEKPGFQIAIGSSFAVDYFVYRDRKIGYSIESIHNVFNLVGVF